jgi:hypothetical protein
MKQLEKLFPGEAEKLKLSQLADKTKGYRLDPSTQALRMGAESQLALSARLGARPLGVGIINSAAAINDFIKSSIDDAPRYAPVLAPIGRFLSATGESKYGKMFSEALKRSKNPNNPQTIMVIHNALRNKNPEYRDAYDNYISLEGDIDGNNQRE